MPNNIAAIKNYTTILDRVYQQEATSSCLDVYKRQGPTRGAPLSAERLSAMPPHSGICSLEPVAR